MQTERERYIASNLEAAGLRPRAVGQTAACRDARGLARELKLAEQAGVAIVTPVDPGYPEPLRHIADPPQALYIRGEAELPHVPVVAIVGSRRASPYGLECAERLAYELALRGVIVVSGLALGIDGAAHRGALKAGAPTLAVLGNGLSRVYPPEHERLAGEVAESGWLMSEYPMESGPMPYHFPRRNRLISGLSLGVVIVEASARSGALITADCALEQGREVFAIPGPIRSSTSQGTHHLLKQGARLVTSVEDILEELRLVPSAGPAVAPPMSGLGPAANRGAKPGLRADMGPGSASPAGGTTSEALVLACVGAAPRTIDAVALESGLAMPEVSSLLLRLEMQHLVRQLPGKRFVKIAQDSGLRAEGLAPSPEPRAPSRCR